MLIVLHFNHVMNSVNLYFLNIAKSYFSISNEKKKKKVLFVNVKRIFLHITEQIIHFKTKQKPNSVARTYYKTCTLKIIFFILSIFVLWKLIFTKIQKKKKF